MSAESIVLGSLLGDAISLGPHWVYDQQEIARKIERPDRFHDPISDYHPGKRAGDLTHYGDQALSLLRHLAAAKRFDLRSWADAWRAYWEDPGTTGYRDGATRKTLGNLQSGLPPEQAGAASHDIAGASRIGPLFLLDWADDESLLTACRDLTGFTHRDPQVIRSAEFFAKLVLLTRRGASIPEAMERAELSDKRLAGWLAAGRESVASAKSDAAALVDHGLSCNLDGGFGGVCHLLLRYPEDPFAALVENAKAGGDNAARGMILGMVYGAKDLLEKLPEEWLDGLNAKAEVEELCREARS